MSFLRPASLAVRASPRIAIANRTTAPFSTRARLLAGSSYGGGDGDPKGENPQDQGAQKASDTEHPGPPPPDVGKGTGGGPTKLGGDGHESAGKEVSKGTDGNSSTGGSGGGSSNGASPKIHKPANPNESTTSSEEVAKHNADFEKRHDRTVNRVGGEEKVDSKFWSGQGGADRSP